MTDYKLAEKFEVRANDRGGWDLLIDDEVFPYHTSLEGPKVDFDHENKFHTVWIPLCVHQPDGTNIILGEN